MRKLHVYLATILLLAGCSVSEDGAADGTTDQPEVSEPSQVEKPEDSNSDPKTDSQTDSTEEAIEELSPEEELALQLPASASLTDWNLILVNPWEPLPEGYHPELIAVQNDQQIDHRVEEAWDAMYQDALAAGHNLFFASGYRSYERQENNFNRTMQGHMDEGLSEEEAREKAKEYLTEPGHSEHHTGLALDIVDEEWIVAGNGLDPEYDTQASQHWLVENMGDYGFILRYPKGKEELTGILYESWHFRYVGVENAQFMIEHQLVLEEYLELFTLRDQLSTE